MALIRRAPLTLAGFPVAVSLSGAETRGIDRVDVVVEGPRALGIDVLHADAFVPPLNDGIDLHPVHISAARRYTPTPVVMLIASQALAAGLAGFGKGQPGR